MNNSKGPFANVNVRKSIEWGIDRSAIARVFGPNARTPQCSLLTPAMPGYKRCTLYPNTANLPKARSLANGHTGEHINYWYTSSAVGASITWLVASQLRAIGFDNIDFRAFSSGVFTALGRRGNDYDLAVVAWAAEFPDPCPYVNKLLSGDTIRDVRNTNTAYFNDPTANALMRQAASLSGQKRLTSCGNLDLRIQRDWAPIAVIDRRNDREFFSARIDTTSIVNSPVYEIDLGKLALK
jgi:ABC-type oligopeptide transport system substrate-binding subunit